MLHPRRLRALSDADCADKIKDSEVDGSRRPSPSLFRQEQADENAYQDDDGSDNESENGS